MKADIGHVEEKDCFQLNRHPCFAGLYNLFPSLKYTFLFVSSSNLLVLFICLLPLTLNLKKPRPAIKKAQSHSETNQDHTEKGHN